MIKKFLTALMLMAITPVALATIYQYEDNSANNGGIADQLESIKSTFDSNTEKFTFDVAFNSNPTDVDGFWLVVNNGPNPKQSDVNELAIMYGDLLTNTLTTYVYNGFNSSNSWATPGILLQSDVNNGVLTSDPGSLSISLDATVINDWPLGGDDYTGIAFDENIGIWFHISTGSNFEYGVNGLSGEITDYSYKSQGWYDIAGKKTTTVPEPTSLVLLGLGLLAVGFTRRNSKT